MTTTLTETNWPVCAQASRRNGRQPPTGETWRSTATPEIGLVFRNQLSRARSDRQTNTNGPPRRALSKPAAFAR